MIRKLDRYVLREMVVPFIIGTLAVVLMFQANMLIALFKNLNLRNVPPLALLQLLVLKTPFFLNMTLPVGIALASSLAISRLTRESELTAMRSAGMPIRRVIRPVLIAGVVVSLLNFFVVERLMPRTEFMARKLGNEINMLALAPDLKSNVVLSIQAYTVSIGTVSRGTAEELALSDVLLIERRAFGQTMLITSPRGTYRNGNWRLETPTFRLLKGETMISGKTERVLEIYEQISVPDLFAQPTNEELPLDELRKSILQLKRMKRDTKMQEVTLHTRFSVPASCLIFALTGPLFAVWLARSGPFVGVLLSVVMVLVYYNAFVISTEIVGRMGWAPPWFAAWLPNLIFLILGAIALWKIE